MKAWNGFKEGRWQKEIDVRDFILCNYTAYYGDESFLAPATERTIRLNEKYQELCRLERQKGVLSINTEKVSSLLTYEPAYLDRENEIIVGFQTDAPLKRGVNPFGGIRMARQACEAYGYSLSEEIEQHFLYRTTHNDGVFRVYTPEMRKARRSGVITGLPDAYGRGRIIGDYRRVPLYGVDFLIKQKENDKLMLGMHQMDDETIRTLEELYRQIDFLAKLKEMAAGYGFDISRPAENAQEAVQWLYFAYLGAIKEQNGAAMSLGRTSTFLDIYFERDLNAGLITESQAQEIIDQFVLKLRMARQLRTPEYNELFAGDPTWVTESIGGMGEDGRSLVTKTSYRFLHTLTNLSPAPEPNLTVLWSSRLPENFKKYCAKMSIETNSIQYENDDLMRERFGDDYGIACCVSAMKIG
ncbi:MAG: formate acetyltransferase, partial [Clostridiales bacterium]|nr:formate acetyltransferase [Clostridiales bacterium]